MSNLTITFRDVIIAVTSAGITWQIVHFLMNRRLRNYHTAEYKEILKKDLDLRLAKIK